MHYLLFDFVENVTANQPHYAKNINVHISPCLPCLLCRAFKKRLSRQTKSIDNGTFDIEIM